MAPRRRPAIQYDPHQPVRREEWLCKWAELRQREYPRRQPARPVIASASRGKKQLFRAEVA